MAKRRWCQQQVFTLDSGLEVWSISEVLFFPVISPDEHYVVGLGYDVSVKREHVRVYHLRKGVFLHKISLKYQNFKEIQTLVSFHLCYVALVDNEKANVINCTEKKFSRSIKCWTGQMTR